MFLKYSIILYISGLLLHLSLCDAVQQQQKENKTPIQDIRYVVENPLRMEYPEYKKFEVSITYNEKYIPETTDSVTIEFKVTTVAPQFNILHVEGEESFNFTRTLKQIKEEQNKPKVSTRFISLHAYYIGRAVLHPNRVILTDKVANKSSIVELAQIGREFNLDVIIVQNEGIWGTAFVVSVSILIVITYINLGAQLDKENMKNLVKKPKNLILGLLISVVVMPLISWFVSGWILHDYVIYRMGSFIFAAGPAASASTMWATLFGSARELSIGIQIASTLISLITMPILLFLMDEGLDLSSGSVGVPYMNLVQTLSVLTFALFIGWYFFGRNPKLQSYSKKITTPLTFIVLLFIIVTSSILYWHIYTMFDQSIMLSSLLITSATYLGSGLLGYLIDFKPENSIAISIGSTYKNSGIAFAVLIVAFRSPDTYIAFVPCLAQVLSSSLILYTIYSIMLLINCIRRRDQPGPIQATTTGTMEENIRASAPHVTLSTEKARSGSITSTNKTESKVDVDIEELVAMNVTDVVPGSPMCKKIEPENAKEDQNNNDNSNSSVDC